MLQADLIFMDLHVFLKERERENGCTLHNNPVEVFLRQ